MKKYVAILVVFAALVSGCASFGVWSPGAQAVVNFICKPTQAQMDEAAKWLVVMDTIQAGVSAAFPAIAIVKASTAMTVLKNGGCFIVAEVEAALILIGDMQAKQMALGGLKAAPATSQFPALWDVVNKAKK